MIEQFIPIDRLKELIHYDPETGIFKWVRNPLARVREDRKPVSSKANTISSSGYLIIQVAGKRWQAHRLAWYYMTCKSPPEFIDHIDGDKLNNKFSNLREATRSDNQCNSKKQTRVFVKGVRVLKSGDFEARVAKHGKTYRKQSASLEEVTTWLQSKRLELHNEFTRHR